MKDAFFREAFSFSFNEIIWITSIIISAFLIRVTILRMPSFQSDESIYTYAGFAISRGVIPYREILLVHPPVMYLTYAIFIQLVGPDFIKLRLCNIGLYLITIFLTYLLAKIVFINQENHRALELLSVVLCAFFPSFFSMSISSLLEIILTSLSLSSVIVYTLYQNVKGRAFLFFTGFLMGCGLVTTLRSIFFIVAIILYHLFRNIRYGKYKTGFIDTVIILLGVAIPPVIVLIFVFFYWHAFSQFYLQVYYLQTVRSAMTQGERLTQISWYFNLISPLIVPMALGGLYSARIAKRQSDWTFILPLWLYSFIFLLTVSPILRITLFHYFFYLSPYLYILSAIGLIQIITLLKRLRDKTKINVNRNVLLISFLLFLTIIIPFLTISKVSNILIPYLHESPYEDIHFKIGEYVATVTNTNDTIWTSEPAIAFFAQRFIVAPNSSDWPFQGFFNDVFNTTYDDHKGLGFVSPDQFIEAWEKEKVKVIVFIKGKGWVPYPDDLLWNGFQNQKGVADYVTEHYVSIKIMGTSEIPYTYEIWLRK